MSATLSFHEIRWSTPEGRPVLDGLNLQFGPERAGLVGRNGVGKSTLLRLAMGEITPLAGRITVNGRLGWLRQDVVQGSIADLFGVRAALAVLDRAEAGAAGLEELAEADWTLPDRMAAALDRMGLAVGPDTPLATLSGGQRTRAGLAALVFDAPDMLLLDEPTNNLDADGRLAVIDLLSGWRGGAVVVSHDRDLLDRVDATVELTSLGATRYGGGYSLYRAARDAELAGAADALAAAMRGVAVEARKRQEQVEKQARRDSRGRADAGNIAPLVAGLRKSAAENSAGNAARRAEARGAEAAANLEAARARIEVLEPLSMQIAPSRLPGGRRVLDVVGLTAPGAGDRRLEPGAAGAPTPVVSPESPQARPLFRDLSFSLTGPERLAITGANGAGKSTLLAIIAGHLVPAAGQAQVHVPFALMDQRAGLMSDDETIIAAWRRLNPGPSENEARAALARFQFRGAAGDQRIGDLSGGQRLRAGLACALGGPQPPQLLILDEPTNHLDLEAVAELEQALSGYDGALIVVSHDPAFLRAIGITREIGL